MGRVFRRVITSLSRVKETCCVEKGSNTPVTFRIVIFKTDPDSLLKSCRSPLKEYVGLFFLFQEAVGGRSFTTHQNLQLFCKLQVPTRMQNCTQQGSIQHDFNINVNILIYLALLIFNILTILACYNFKTKKRQCNRPTQI